MTEHALHVVEYAGCNQAIEGVRRKVSDCEKSNQLAPPCAEREQLTEENRSPESKLLARVPLGEQQKCTGEESGFYEAKEEAAQDDADKVGGDTSEAG